MGDKVERLFTLIIKRFRLQIELKVKPNQNNRSLQVSLRCVKVIYHIFPHGLYHIDGGKLLNRDIKDKTESLVAIRNNNSQLTYKLLS